MADLTQIMKLVRSLGQSIGARRGVGMLGPLKQGLEAEPELTSFLQTADKIAKGIPGKALQDASAEYNDLLQSAMTYFKPGLKGPEAATAAKTGIDQFLKSASERIGRKAGPVEEAIEDPTSIFQKLFGAESGKSALAGKAQDIYRKASPRLKAYLDHITDPSKPRPEGGRKVFQEELRTLRGEATGKRRIAPPRRGKEVPAQAPEWEPGTKDWLIKQDPPGSRGSKMDPDQIQAAKAKMEATVPEGREAFLTGVDVPGTPRLPEWSAGRESAEMEDRIMDAFGKLFPKKVPKPRRSLKSEVSPE